MRPPDREKHDRGGTGGDGAAPTTPRSGSLTGSIEEETVKRAARPLGALMAWTFAVAGAVLYWTSGIMYLRRTVEMARERREAIDGSP